jgi:hypothetical protein
MRLGGLIDTLEQLPGELPVYFSDGRHPTTFASWRGVYAELTLYEGNDYDPDGEDHWPSLPVLTVAELLEQARAAVGETFEGYKGGDFVMSRDTAVWADDYGACNHDAIMGVTVNDGKVELTIMNLSDYRGY